MCLKWILNDTLSKTQKGTPTISASNNWMEFRSGCVLNLFTNQTHWGALDYVWNEEGRKHCLIYPIKVRFSLTRDHTFSRCIHLDTVIHTNSLVQQTGYQVCSEDKQTGILTTFLFIVLIIDLRLLKPWKAVTLNYVQPTTDYASLYVFYMFIFIYFYIYVFIYHFKLRKNAHLSDLVLKRISTVPTSENIESIA